MENPGTDRKVKCPALPIGNSDWSAVKAGYWSADKTQLISGLLEKKSTVAVFTRPRRFGKTFALRMLRTFFEKTEKSNAHLFKGTKVWRNAEHRAEQGRYPVVYVTLKDAKASSWELMKAFIRGAVADEFRRHNAVFASRKCDRWFKAASESMRMRTADDETITASLGILAKAVHVHYGEKPVILIDEYDSPINYAATHGFGEECLQFFRNFLSTAMKDGEHCRLGVMTGILRIAKEGVLSGLNNPKVYSVFDEAFSDCFGFTEDEVRGMLATFGHPEKFAEAKDWYDGYLFGGREMYNPWSLLNYVDDGFKPQTYWINTSSNDLVTDVISRMTPVMRDALADFFALGAFGRRNLLEQDFAETPFGQERRTQRVVGSELEVPDEAFVLARDGVVHQFGKRVFLTADHLDRADEPVLGIRALVFDGEVLRDLLVQRVRDEHGMSLVQGVRTDFQLRIRLVQQRYQGYRDDEEYRRKYYVDFAHSGAERIW